MVNLVRQLRQTIAAAPTFAYRATPQSHGPAYERPGGLSTAARALPVAYMISDSAVAASSCWRTRSMVLSSGPHHSTATSAPTNPITNSSGPRRLSTQYASVVWSRSAASSASGRNPSGFSTVPVTRGSRPAIRSCFVRVTSRSATSSGTMARYPRSRPVQAVQSRAPSPVGEWQPPHSVVVDDTGLVVPALVQRCRQHFEHGPGDGDPVRAGLDGDLAGPVVRCHGDEGVAVAILQRERSGVHVFPFHVVAPL